MNDSTESEKQFTPGSPEEERGEAEQWYQEFISTESEPDEALKANLRLEELLLMTEDEGLRDEYLTRLLERSMERSHDKESLDFKDEFFVIHSILTVGEVIKHHNELIKSPHTARIYGFTQVKSSVITGMAHQKFQEIMANADDTAKKQVMDSVWAMLK